MKKNQRLVWLWMLAGCFYACAEEHGTPSSAGPEAEQDVFVDTNHSDLNYDLEEEEVAQEDIPDVENVESHDVLDVHDIPNLDEVLDADETSDQDINDENNAQADVSEDMDVSEVDANQDLMWEIVDSGQVYEDCESLVSCGEVLPENYSELGCYQNNVYLQRIKLQEHLTQDRLCVCARNITEVLLQEDCQSQGLSCAGGKCVPKYVRIEPGFLLGDEVSIPTGISRPFWMSSTEITQRDYAQVTGEINYYRSPHPEKPINNISWLDAIRYSNLLSTSEGLLPCYDDHGNVIGGDMRNPHLCEGYRLPTETEWVYACQANTYGGLYCNEDRECFRQHEWIENDFPDGHYEIQWVAQRQPNPYGIYDMMGNVGEWIFDSFVDWGVYAEGVNNYIVNDSNWKKNNGMSINDGLWGYTCLSDNYNNVRQTANTIGFRVVKTIFEGEP